jgi:hypothetical protein
VMGRGALYYVTIGAIVSVLALSANTSFADFPRICRMLAGDGFLPEPFVHRGRRLTFSHGIVALSVLSAILLFTFRGITDRLIPLFATGALFAFTMSQAGMVAHWHKSKGAHARKAMILNSVGCLATSVTLCIVLASKFAAGAWISIVLVAAMIVLFRRVRRHYDFIASVTATDASLEIGPPSPPIAVVPMRRWDAITLKALRFAIGFTEDVVAVQVLTHDRAIDDLTQRWDKLVARPARELGMKPPTLEVRPSEYRQLFTPLLAFINELAEKNPARQIAVIVPELVEPRWYYRLLHNQDASLMKALLLLRGGPQIVVVNTPWYLRDWKPERRRLLRSPSRERRESRFRRPKAASHTPSPGTR